VAIKRRRAARLLTASPDSLADTAFFNKFLAALAAKGGAAEALTTLTLPSLPQNFPAWISPVDEKFHFKLKISIYGSNKCFFLITPFDK